jgi:hypothetical protein
MLVRRLDGSREPQREKGFHAEAALIQRQMKAA